MVVLQAEDRQFGLVVDGINDTQEIVVKPLGKQLKGLTLYAGATIMGDGRVALILDVLGIGQRSGVLAEFFEQTRASGQQKAPVEIEQQRLLLFRAGSFARLAVPLSLVARLEEFPQSAIEHASGGQVVQYTDLGAAMEAVNEGNIFRFLTKPCAKEVLVAAINSGVEQYELIRSERDLLEKTLLGSIKVLADVLGASSPEAFGMSLRIAQCVRHVANKFTFAFRWRLEAAAALSQLGCVTLDPQLVQKSVGGTKASAGRSSPLRYSPPSSYETSRRHPQAGTDCVDDWSTAAGGDPDAGSRPVCGVFARDDLRRQDSQTCGCLRSSSD